MENIRAEYQVTLSDFRRASYFGLCLRHRRPLQIMVVVLAVAVLYMIGAQMGLGQLNALVPLLAAAYLVWGLLLFAGAERDIRRYMKLPDSLIGCTYDVEIESHRIRFSIPSRNIQFATQINKLTCVFELSQMFLVYVSPQEVYILPHRCLTAAQRTSLRAVFAERLGEKFSTRFHE